MERLTKIATIRNDVEAMCLRSELQQRGIPHVIESYHDFAYDGLFQYTIGWGHVEAGAEHRNEILEILDDLRSGSEDESE
jgi:hypothetical protein